MKFNKFTQPSAKEVADQSGDSPSPAAPKKPCQSVKNRIHFFGLCSIQSMTPAATRDSGKVTCLHCLKMLRKQA